MGSGGPLATACSDLGIESNCCFCCSGLCRKVTTQQQQCTPKGLRCTALSEPRGERGNTLLCCDLLHCTGLKAPRAGGGGGGVPDGRLLSLQPCTLVDPFIQDASDLQLFPSASGRLSQRSPKPLHISEDRRIILPFWGFPCLPLSLGLVSFMIGFLIGKFVDIIRLS